jgi:hypothetical protein
MSVLLSSVVREGTTLSRRAILALGSAVDSFLQAHQDAFKVFRCSVKRSRAARRRRPGDYLLVATTT